MPPIDALSGQLQEQRRTVDFDTYDIVTQQLVTMVGDMTIHVAPVYQRKFRWDDVRCSQLVESLLLGIPVPSLFMATNPDGTWEVVDGVQRLSAIIKFAGDDQLRQRIGLGAPLQLQGLQKITSFEGQKFASLPPVIRLHFSTRPVKVVTLSDKSDTVVRLDLFERLNTGGIVLSDQEIRDCVYQGEFANLLEELAADKNFKHVVRLQRGQEGDGTREECVLRFFAYLNNYKKFQHSVVGFLNDYMKTATKSFNHAAGRKLFTTTFLQLAAAFPEGLHRSGNKRRTSLVLFEGVAVGAAMAIKKKGKISLKNLNKWLASTELKGFTTGATNDMRAVRGRIEFCRDRFLGK